MARRSGWRRLGRRRFRYVDSRGREIDDDVALERIRALAVPPAWTDVWISPNPHARLQATGTDRAGRTQYLYHASYRAARERAKFDRLLRFASSLPGLRSRTAEHLRIGPYDREWACALAVGLMNRTWFRVGSDRHARRSRTYRVTTLVKRHVSVDGDVVDFCFRGKNRRLVRRSVRSAALARGVEDLPAGRRAREPHLGAAERLPRRAHFGDGFTAKDFRTWGGTLLAAVELDRRGPPPDETEAKRALAAVMRRVGTELGNTPAVARDSYVSPVVVQAYREGRTLGAFRRRARGSRRTGLTADERALVRFLQAETP